MTTEPLTESVDRSGVWLDVVAAVDYLSFGLRPGLTVWGALAEAIDLWTVARLDEPTTRRAHAPWEDPDELRSALDRLMGSTGGPGTIDGCSLADALDAALGHWLLEMADLHNEGHRYAHPRPRSGWPSLAPAIGEPRALPTG